MFVIIFFSLAIVVIFIVVERFVVYHDSTEKYVLFATDERMTGRTKKNLFSGSTSLNEDVITILVEEYVMLATNKRMTRKELIQWKNVFGPRYCDYFWWRNL